MKKIQVLLYIYKVMLLQIQGQIAKWNIAESMFETCLPRRRLNNQLKIQFLEKTTKNKVLLNQ
jgi:hypothetical protein